MSAGRIYLLAAIMLIIGLVVGGAAIHLMDRNHHSRHARMAAVRLHYPRVDQTAPNARNNSGNWDPMAQMDRMQQEIDQSIHRAMQQFRSVQLPDLSGPGFASTMDVRDKGDHFEVRADLPNVDKKDVKVTTEGDRQVRVNVTQHEEQDKNANGGQSSFREFGTYNQLVTLPEAADMKDMKVDNHNGELVITIPKAKAT
jgi:HSP20 family protein